MSAGCSLKVGCQVEDALVLRKSMMHQDELAPIGDCATPLNIHNHPLAFNLLPVGHLVGCLHVVLVLKFNESIASRLACTMLRECASQETYKSFLWSLAVIQGLRCHLYMIAAMHTLMLIERRCSNSA